MRPSRPLVLAAASAAAALLLSGCGVAGTNFQPGVAARVGERTITVDAVDSLVGRYCTAIEQQLRDGNQVVPLTYFRSGVTGQLAIKAAAEQVGELYGVGPGEQYRLAVAQINDVVSELPDDVAQAVREIETSDEYVEDIATAVGRKQLRDRGQSDPGLTDSTDLGQQTLSDWIDDNDVEIDPRFGIEIQDAQAAPIDASVSYAASDSAAAAAALSPDQEYASRLPESSRCG